MTIKYLPLSLALIACVGLSACQVAKTTGQVAALPFKAVYKTGEMAGKGVVGTTKLAGKSVYYTGKYTGKGIYETGKFAGKSVSAIGKGVYYIGTVPVTITDKALDTTAKVLTITTQAADTSGKVLEVTRRIQATELDAELAAIKGASNILKVFVDANS